LIIKIKAARLLLALICAGSLMLAVKFAYAEKCPADCILRQSLDADQFKELVLESYPIGSSAKILEEDWTSINLIWSGKKPSPAKVEKGRREWLAPPCGDSVSSISGMYKRGHFILIAWCADEQNKITWQHAAWEIVPMGN
jgi:hypothetical protein